MSVTLAPVRPILRVQDICDLLRISESQFYALKAAGRFGGKLPALVEVQPAIDTAPRYQGEPFALWLSSRNQARLLREQLEAVEGRAQ